MSRRISIGLKLLLFALVLLIPAVIFPMQADASTPTTSLTIKKLAVDGTTVLSEKTVTYQELAAGELSDGTDIAILGDGTTHYYHQGMVSVDNADDATEETLRWNQAEDNNNLEDMGALKGTNLKDLCNLVGGMEDGETVKIIASDTFKKTFAYKNVYQYSSKEGPMVICWWKDGAYPDGTYTKGMRLVWFADASTNPWGYHVFGNWDWHEAADSSYWYYYYQSATERYPTTTGLSVQNVAGITIYSNDPVPAVAAFSADKTSGGIPLTVNFTDASTGTPTAWAWDFNNDGTTDSTSQNPSYQYATAGTYTVKLTVTNANGSDDEIKTNYITVNAASSMTVLYNGTVDLTPDATFTLTSYNGATPPVNTQHSVSETTPLGALQAAATAADFTYLTNDKKYTDSGILLLDNINTDTNDYNFVKSNYSWYVYVKKASSETYTYLDDYNSPTTLGLNIYQVEDGDKVEFYYAYKPSNSNYATVTAIATAAVKTVVNTDTMTVLYNGTVDLTPDATFTLTSYNGATPPVNTQHSVSETTPLGALQAAATAADFTYLTNDKKYTDSGILLLDNINTDTNDYNFVKSNYSWYVYVKKASSETYTYLDDYNSPTTLGLNIYQVEDGDKVEFYYAYKPSNSNYATVTAIATAAVKTVVDLVGVTPDDWTLELSGAKTEDVTKAYFEQGLACQHEVTWTDGDGNIWGGIPLWLLVGMVDDNPDVGTKHFNFNDDLAAEHYEITVKSGDGWETTLDSADIARSSDYIVANTLNGEPLPELTDSETPKPCWPLILKGAGISGGQQVGNIVSIELSGLPDPDAGWTLDMQGEIGDTITQAEFEEGVECQHGVEWTDAAGKVWSGVPLWVLVGTVDDIENSSHWTFSDSVAAQGYTVKVYDEAGNYKTFTAAEIARNNNYIVANVYDGNPLTGDCPLRLVGSAVATDGVLGDNAIANIAMIELPELETPAAASGSYNLTVDGKISDVLSQAELEAAMACAQSGHNVTWTDADGKVWSGMPLWFLTGWVDDRVPHGYNYSQAQAGYTITVKAADGYSKQFDSADIANSSDYIIANMYDGAALDESIWPLRLVGDGVATDKVLNGNSISQIAEIKLTDFQTEDDIPQLHIVKYDTDGTTILSEVTIDYEYMEDNLDVYGDGTTVYKYEAITNDPDNLWDEDGNYETYGYKISNAVKGSLIKDLCDLVGGMGAGTDVKLVASDGYETILPYDNIYTNPAVQAIQGDAILAWYADGKYVPYYDEGMRVFFLAPDEVYGQWDMHESLDSDYWHYYFSDNIQYPSCAGTSSKYITEIKVYSSPASDWELHLDGTDVGGDSYDISKTYFESAVACQLGSNHAETYTDGNGDEWTGLPLYFLAGYVDDGNRHSDGAFNDTLASNGYNVILETGDGSLLVIDSKDMMNNRDMVVANTVNDVAIADDDADWPLKIVGSDIDDELSFGNIVSIRLENYCTVTFDKNTGDTEANPTTLTNPGGAVWTLPTEPTKAGYTFVGWNTAADGSGEDFNEETFVIDDITVYAQWQQTDKYSLTAVADDAYSSIVNNIGVVEFTAKKGGLVLFGVDVNAPYQAHAGKETVVFVHLRNGVQLSYNTTVADFDTVDGAQAGFDVQAGDVVKVYIVDSLTNSTASNPNYLQ